QDKLDWEARETNERKRLLDPGEDEAVLPKGEYPTKQNQRPQCPHAPGAYTPRCPPCQHEHRYPRIIGSHERLLVLETRALGDLVGVEQWHQKVRPTPSRHGPLRRCHIAGTLRVRQQVEERKQLGRGQTRN